VKFKTRYPIIARAWINSGGIFDLDQRRAKIAEFEKLMESPDFWNNRDNAQQIIDACNAENTGLKVGEI
jgi:hypothetical protein